MLSVKYFPFQIIALFFLCSYAPKTFGTEISLITPSDVEVRSGDIVALEVRAKLGFAKIEWWREGKLECESPRCEIDTTDFGTGKYVYHAIVAGAEGVAYSTVTISTVPSEPLYQPKRLSPQLVAPPAEKSFSIKTGEWQIFTRVGVVTYDTAANAQEKKSEANDQQQQFNLKKIKKLGLIATTAKSRPDVIYRVPSGTQAFVRRVNQDEEWLISPESSFKIVQGTFELLSGQAIWRKLHDKRYSTNNPSQPANGIVAGARLKADGSWFVGVEIGFDKQQMPKATIKNIEGKTVEIQCASTATLVIPQGKTKVVNLDDKNQCKDIDPQTFSIGNLSATSSNWFNWWGKIVAPRPADRWRAEYPLTQGLKSEKELTEFAAEGLKDGYCADVLDYLGSALAEYKDQPNFLNAHGSCQLELGLYKQSFITFSVLERLQTLPARAAFMLGKSHQGLGQHHEALVWFLTAEQRQMPERTLLARTALKSAIAAKDSKEQLRWLEVIAIDEENAEQRIVDKENAEIWREIRPKGATITGSFFMDGQALPLNSKKTLAMPEGTHTSRSVVFAVEGAWWTTKHLTQDARLRLSGSHNYYRPQEKGLTIATKSIHDFKLGLLIGEYLNAGQQPSDRWILDLSAIVGTGLSGGERQRDHFGSSFSVSRPKWKNIKFGINSDKYLDPKPDGADVIDLDLNRYTGEGDHSHIDLTTWLSIEDYFGPMYFKTKIGYGTIDYRTGALDALDHTLLLTEIELRYQLDHLSQLIFNPSFVSRTHEGDNGNDQTTALKCSYNYHTDALWRATLFANLENRNVSKDETASWSRHMYGLSLTRDF